MRRRTFLGVCGLGLGAGAGAAALWRGALAGAGTGAARPPRRLALVFASGGWDTTYAIDPKEPTQADIPAGAVQRFEAVVAQYSPRHHSLRIDRQAHERESQRRNEL